MASKSGFDYWVAPRVRSERAIVKGIMADTGRGSAKGGKSVKANNQYKVRTTVRGNSGSFKK